MDDDDEVDPEVFQPAKDALRAAIAAFFEAVEPLEVALDAERFGQGFVVLTIADLDQFKHFGVNDGYASNTRRFYSPWDDAHPVIMALLGEVRTSYVSSDYGFTDTDVAAKVDEFLRDPKIYTQITLDSSQAAGKTEREVLAQLLHDATGNSIAIGRSERGEIIHRKMRIINGVWLLTGSTNLSLNGEQKQDNELTVTYDPIACAEARHILDLSHTKALKDMAARKAA